MALAGTDRFRVDDLDWARQQWGTHAELDPWGNLVVSPASDLHERAVANLHNQIVSQLVLPAGNVLSHSPAWRVPDGSGYTNVADIVVLARDCRRVGQDDLHFDPAPLLVVEVASPSTRAVDRGRKLEDYRRGGARLYLLVDLPGLAPVDQSTGELHDLGAGASAVTTTGELTLTVDDVALTIDLAGLLSPGWQ